MLQTGRSYNVNQLAQELGRHRRTIFRDLEELKAAELGVVFDEDRNGYVFRGPTLTPTASLTVDEALAMLVMSESLGNRGDGLPLLSAARSAIHKFYGALPRSLQEHVGDINGLIQLRLDARNPLPGAEQVYSQLQDALRERRCVRLTYESVSEKKVISTRFSPYSLFFSRRSWYVVGRSTVHAEVRLFNLSRIQRVELTGYTYRIPRRFTLEKHLGNAWHLIRGRERNATVIVRFSPRVATNVAEVVWHKTQRTARQPDGSLLFEVTVDGLEEISWWIMGYGPEAVVEQPSELRAKILTATRTMLENYVRSETENGPHQESMLPPRSKPRRRNHPSSDSQ